MYFVYILSNWDDSVLYIGVSGNLPRRLYEHKNSLAEGFSKQYNVHKLVYFEETNDVYSAISREKQLKKMEQSQEKRPCQQHESPMEGFVSGLGLTVLFHCITISPCEDPSTRFACSG